MAHIHATGFYMVSEYKGMLSGTINGVASLNAVGRELHECCAVYEFEFATEPTDGLMFLTVDSMQIGASVSGNMDDYVIEWRLGSTTGEIVFVTGEGTDPAIQAQHPFTDEVVFAGTLYPVIRYVWVDSIQYVSHWDDMDSDSLYAPDLITCLDPVIVTAITCSTVLGTHAVYQYWLTYRNTVDLGQDKSRKLKFEICNSSSVAMTYLAWEFCTFTVADQIKIYYCGGDDPDGVLVDNFIVGYQNGQGVALTMDLEPSGYPENERTFYTQGTPVYFQFVTDLRDFSYTEGDYLRIEIVGSPLTPSLTNTDWDLGLQWLEEEDIVCDFYSTDISKITDTPVMSWVTSSTRCYYNVTYNVLENPGTAGNNKATNPYSLFKYFYLRYLYAFNEASNYALTSPINNSLRWYTRFQNAYIYYAGNFTSCVNIPAGGTWTIYKDTESLMLVCTEETTYNVLKANIASIQATADWTAYLASNDTQEIWYGYYYISFHDADSCGDTMAHRQFQVWFNNTITWDDDNYTFEITLDVPSANNTPDPGVCNEVHASIDSLINTLTTYKNTVTPSDGYTSSVHYSGIISGMKPQGTLVSDTSNYPLPNNGYYFILNVLMNGICDLNALGFCSKSTTEGTTWYLYRYYDMVTLLSTATHEDRLANWKLERLIGLRTDVCTDLDNWTYPTGDWELVYSTTAMRSSPAGVAVVSGILGYTLSGSGMTDGSTVVGGTLYGHGRLYGSVEGVATISGALKGDGNLAGEIIISALEEMVIDFEDYSTGALAGQDGWTTASGSVYVGESGGNKYAYGNTQGGCYRSIASYNSKLEMKLIDIGDYNALFIGCSSTESMSTIYLSCDQWGTPWIGVSFKKTFPEIYAYAYRTGNYSDGDVIGFEVIGNSTLKIYRNGAVDTAFGTSDNLTYMTGTAGQYAFVSSPSWPATGLLMGIDLGSASSKVDDISMMEETPFVTGTLNGMSSPHGVSSGTTVAGGTLSADALISGSILPQYAVKYGLLYNWEAARHTNNLANTGWHVCTVEEFMALRTFLGTNECHKLREVGTTYWSSPNTGATNIYGFNARGAGVRSWYDGTFGLSKGACYIQCGNLYGGVQYVYAILRTVSYISYANWDENQNLQGHSIRLVNDSTTLTHGQAGIYKGNDGKIYRTICIDGVEWLADNLAETKYRNGDTIPEVTDNATWIALTTGALCAYSNNWSNVIETSYTQSVSGRLKPTFFGVVTGVAAVSGTLTEG